MNVGAAIEQAAREHPALVADVARQRPGAWGALAAKGVMAFRARAGRRPSEAERRAIWAGLWSLVNATPRDCGHEIDHRTYAVCAVCAGLRLCLDCARGHLCGPTCLGAGCAPGGCVRIVRDGVAGDRFGSG